MRITAGHTQTDNKTNAQIAKEIKITPILEKLLDYKRKWIQHVNRVPHNRLPRVMKHYSPTGWRNHGRPWKRLLDTWDWNGSKSGPTPWQIYDDDDDDDDDDVNNKWVRLSVFCSMWRTSSGVSSYKISNPMINRKHYLKLPRNSQGT